MSISETFRPTTISGAQVLAWPIIGGKDALFGKSASIDEDVRALQGIGTKLRIPHNGTIFTRGRCRRSCL